MKRLQAHLSCFWLPLWLPLWVRGRMFGFFYDMSRSHPPKPPRGGGSAKKPPRSHPRWLRDGYFPFLGCELAVFGDVFCLFFFFAMSHGNDKHQGVRSGFVLVTFMIP